jgi:polysaccharide pyruvyl transferase WcaK-like protein
LHALIFAARGGALAAGIVCDEKIEAYIELLSMPSCGDYRQFRAEEAFNAVLPLVERREELLSALRKAAVEQEELSRRNPAKLLGLLEAE